MSSRKAIWIKDPKLITRFNHWKLDHGNDPSVALKELLDIAEEANNGDALV